MKYHKLSEQIYFSKEAARYLGISIQRLNQLVHAHKIKPLKKNSSGSIFLLSELKQRKEELDIFNIKKRGGEPGMFKIDSRIKQEALNFATLMNALQYTEHKLEPLFDNLSKIVDISAPLDQKSIVGKYSQFFCIEVNTLLSEYKKAKNAFSQLHSTDEIIKRGSQDYPSLLAKTKQAPRFLYIRGKKSLLQEARTVALVGSRSATEHAKENTARLAEILGNNGITIVSGLAKGIDVTAHVSALGSGFNTIAVIGTNLNQYYPMENKSVQIEIEKKGVIVSQFSPASKTQRWFFPLRNGVMSGLSLATVIMEAGETSGALKQADFALKQGREVLIPERALEINTITWPAKYVKRGAKIVKSPKDVINFLAKCKIFKKDSMNLQESFDFNKKNKNSDMVDSTEDYKLVSSLDLHE